MGEVVTSLIMPFIKWIKVNYRKPKLWIIAIIFIILIFWLIPYIDSNFFYYGRMEKRISILQQLTELDQEKVGSNEILQNEYENILNDIQVQEERMVSSIITNITNVINNYFKVKPREGNMLLKFFSGAALSFIIAVFVPFMKTFSSKKEKILALILVIVFGCILGGLATIIPTIINPNLNYWGTPIAQLILLILLLTRTGKRNKRKETQQ